MTPLLVMVALLVALNVIAVRWGVDSRRNYGDWQPQGAAQTSSPRLRVR